MPWVRACAQVTTDVFVRLRACMRGATERELEGLRRKLKATNEEIAKIEAQVRDGHV